MPEIAIIGLGCRFPQAENPQAFWELLRNGKNAITEIPKNRWDVDAFYAPKPGTPGKTNERWGGFLEQIDRFDRGFFGIPSQQAIEMDPQQRLVLEVAWEALENAGIVPSKLAGSSTGVFLGMASLDYYKILYQELQRITAWSLTGTSLSIAANRLSYLLDLQGPSMAIDTGCSASLVALHSACHSLHALESDLCLVGGVNAICCPDGDICYSQAGLSAPDGRCKTFDAEANGYVRGEGCGIVVLKRLWEARQDGDRIQAIIRGSAIAHNGLTNGLSSPSIASQKTLLQRALKNAGVTPAQIGYVETHGTGTRLGDTMEVRALKAVLMEGRQPEQTCWLGSVKPNIGHLEAASGIASLIKVVLSLQHQEIPPQVHLNQLNPHLKIEDTPLKIPTQYQKWETGEERRFAGVSALGLGGMNAHVILEGTGNGVWPSLEDSQLSILTLSAKSEKALMALVGRYGEFLEEHPTISFGDLCFTANTGRSHFQHRLAIIAESPQQLKQQLHTCAIGKESASIFQGRSSKEELTVVFRLSDRHIVSSDDIRELHKTAKLWQSWGIQPQGVMGDGMGKIIAACIAGVFDLEDAIKIIQEEGSILPQIAYSAPNIPLLDARTGEPILEEIATANYWQNRLQRSERLENPSLPGYPIVIDIDISKDWPTLLQELAGFYVQGITVNWDSFYSDSTYCKLSLPTYPWQRQRYWFDD